MNGSRVYCTKCNRLLPPEIFNRKRFSPCRGCGARVMVATFPALLAGAKAGTHPETLLMDDEASCFYHPNKKAAVPCEHCGRFLCRLCEVKIGNRVLCPGCIASGEDKKKFTELETSHTRYDTLALHLAIFPAVITPLISLYLAARYWSKPVSVIPHTHARWVFAILIALAQTSMWTMIFFT